MENLWYVGSTPSRLFWGDNLLRQKMCRLWGTYRLDTKYRNYYVEVISYTVIIKCHHKRIKGFVYQNWPVGWNHPPLGVWSWQRPGQAMRPLNIVMQRPFNHPVIFIVQYSSKSIGYGPRHLLVVEVLRSAILVKFCRQISHSFSLTALVFVELLTDSSTMTLFETYEFVLSAHISLALYIICLTDLTIRATLPPVSTFLVQAGFG